MVNPTPESAVILGLRQYFGAMAVFLGRKKFLKNFKKTLDIIWAICFNATISLGADEKTHSARISGNVL